MFDIVALGELLIDFTPAGWSEAGSRRFEQNPGGAVANVLATAAKFGNRCAFIGKVGADMFGDFLRQTFTDLSIDCSNLLTDPLYHTTLAFVALDDSGERSFSFYRNHGADTRLAPEEVNLDLIEDCRIFHFGTLSMTHSEARAATLIALQTARNAGKVVSFDPNYRPLLWDEENKAIQAMQDGLTYTNIAKLSLEEAQMITGETEPVACLKAILDYGLDFAAITMGPQGGIYATATQSSTYPAYPAKVVDTTGAGDIFWGTVLFELLKSGTDIRRLPEKDLARIVQTASIAAAISTEKKGGIPSIPDYAKVESVLAGIG